MSLKDTHSYEHLTTDSYVGARFFLLHKITKLHFHIAINFILLSTMMLIILKLPYPQLKVSLIDAYCNSICMLILLAAHQRRVLFFVLFYSAVFRRWYTSLLPLPIRALCGVIVLSFCNESGKYIFYLLLMNVVRLLGGRCCYDISTPSSSSHQMARYPRAFL